MNRFVPLLRDAWLRCRARVAPFAAACRTRLGALGAGEGMLLSTYSGPVAEPVTNRIPVSITTTAATHAELGQQLWDGLDAERRVLVAGFNPHDHLADPFLRNAVDL